MDFVSHAIIGRAMALSPNNSKKSIYWTTFFSVLPDIPQIILYLYLGIIKARTFWIPLNADWDGFRSLHPSWSVLWEIPHSIFFVVGIILPIVIYAKLPKMALGAYGLHIVVDILTHQGEWVVKPFYPLSFEMHGMVNAWAWPLESIIFSWLVLSFILIGLNIFFNQPKVNLAKEYDDIRLP